MPVGEAPHRRLDQDPGRMERLELCRLATAGDEWLTVSSLEVDREGPSYTATTLALLRGQRPTDELWLILGADQAMSLPQWHEPEHVLSIASLAIAEREDARRADVETAIAALPGSERARFFSMPRIDVSSSMVRERVAASRPIKHLVPRGVDARIAERGLYREPVAGRSRAG
jgi:nicotinate-nucleotide adenylyltransferase